MMTPAQVIPDSTKNHWLFYILPSGSVVLNGSLDYAKNTFTSSGSQPRWGPAEPGMWGYQVRVP